MNNNLIVTDNSDFVQDALLSVIKGKLVRALDLKNSFSEDLTDTLLIYLSDEKNIALNQADLLLKIFGYMPDAGKICMGLSLDFCYGHYLKNVDFPDKSTLDRKCYFEPKESEIEKLINNPKYGFKKAIGQRVMNLEIANSELPILNLKIDSVAIQFINVSFFENDEIEGNRYKLYIYYD